MFGGDSIGLRIAQPLRVAAAASITACHRLRLCHRAGERWTVQRLNLAPAGRELDIEARYSAYLIGGALQTNLFWRREPGNIAAAPADIGLALRWARGF